MPLLYSQPSSGALVALLTTLFPCADVLCICDPAWPAAPGAVF